MGKGRREHQPLHTFITHPPNHPHAPVRNSAADDPQTARLRDPAIDRPAQSSAGLILAGDTVNVEGDPVERKHPPTTNH
jgi:hypothetical protein